jgi:hypothetical protein
MKRLEYDDVPTRAHIDDRQMRPRAQRRVERPGEQKRRGPGPLEEPARSGPKAFLCGWRGLTPQWPRSLRLGSASGFKVAPGLGDCNPASDISPARSGKSVRERFARRALRVDRHGRDGGEWVSGVTSCRSILPLYARSCRSSHHLPLDPAARRGQAGQAAVASALPVEPSA